MDSAVRASKRATCKSAHVGSILVPRGSTVAIDGYCGSPKGVKHCDEIGCIKLNNHCITTVHSELNSIIQAASLGISTKDSTMYVTHFPCINCLKAMVNARIQRVYYKNFYPYKSEPEKELFDLILDSKRIEIFKFGKMFPIYHYENFERLEK